MQNKINRSITEPIRKNLSWSELWEQHDKGLVLCWERGRQKSNEQPELAAKAINNELPVLGWKGGIDKAIQKKQKYGCLNYLAQWQGLRGEDLNINREVETELTCSNTGMKIIFTHDKSKYKTG